MNSKYNKTNIMLCECSNPTHQIILNHDKEDKMVYCFIHLNKLTFFQRIKYLFGWKSNYGAFEEFIITERHTEELENILKTIKNKN